ncbi:MAG TPA: alkaline phosphatase family protein [Bacteroidetes bacterium]|nr:alkaline phosphatase family protein [Bacteroidota bacterium]
MKNKNTVLLFFLFFQLIIFQSCGKKLTPLIGNNITNNNAALKAPYVILISLDGYRWDYTQKFKPPNISNFIKEGVQAESMIPCFPSKTFPNHYSIVTGMYPDHHGLVDNSYFNLDKNGIYKIRDREKVEDGSWYNGTPLWVQAVKSGMVAASFFFVGSEADIQGTRPTYYYRYTSSMPNEKRVEQAIDWLKMPAKKRPHLITLYFSDMDDTGHAVGPNADKILKEKLMKLDTVLGRLFDGVKKTGLPVDIFIVSDHGMTNVPNKQLIPVEYIENDSLYRTVNNGPVAHIYLHNKVDSTAAFNYLKSKEKHYKTYFTKDCPQFEIMPENKNWGDIQVVIDLGWYFVSQRRIAVANKMMGKIKGQHGFDPKYKDMHAIFYGNGFNIKKGHKIPSFKNIHVYPLICKILGLDVPKDVDGKLEVLDDILIK